MTRFFSTKRVFTTNVAALVFVMSGAFSALAVGTDPRDIPEGAHVTGPAIIAELTIAEDSPNSGTFTASGTGTCKNLSDRTLSLNVTDLAIAGNFAGSTSEEVEDFVEGFYFETTEIGNLDECFTEAQLGEIDGLVVNTVTRVILFQQASPTTFVANVILLPVVDPNN